MRRRLLIGSIGSLFALSVGCSDDPAPADASTDVVVNDVPAADVPATDLGALDAGVDAGRADGGATDLGSPDSGARDVPVATDVVDVPVAVDATDAGAVDAPATDGGVACTPTRALVTTSDYVMGGYAIGPIAPPALTASGTLSPDQDHVPVQSGCVVYNLLRTNDVLAVLDNAALPAVARRIPLRMMGAADAGTADAGPPPGNQVNPYDVLTLSPTRALVAQYALPRLGIVNPSVDGAAGVVGSVDLSSLRPAADTDASPEAAAILQVGSRIFVSLQHLNNYAVVTNGSLAVLNASDLTLVDADAVATGVQALTLGGRNPIAMVTTPTAASIVVASAGVLYRTPAVLDGVIERVNPTTFAISGTTVTEAALGGDLGGVVMLDENRGWAVVSRPAVGDASVADSRVVEFNLSTGAVGATILTTGSIGGIARDPSGNVWVLDRSATTPGVRVLRPDGTSITTMSIATGAQPPYGIAFVP